MDVIIKRVETTVIDASNYEELSYIRSYYDVTFWVISGHIKLTGTIVWDAPLDEEKIIKRITDQVKIGV